MTYGALSDLPLSQNKYLISFPISNPTTTTLIQTPICLLNDYHIMTNYPLFLDSDHNLIYPCQWLILSFIISLKFLSEVLIMIKFVLHSLTGSSSSGPLLAFWSSLNVFQHVSSSVLPLHHIIAGFWCLELCHLSTMNALEDWKHILPLWSLSWLLFYRNFRRIPVYLY